MANPEHVKLVKRGAKAIMEWRETNPGSWFHLSKANLHAADLRGADLSWADLRNADLSEADLSGACLDAACLNSADLRCADLSVATLRNTYLSMTDLRRATFGFTTIADVDLRTLKNLDEVAHQGPSHISTDTLVRLQGNVSKEITAFLQGCGLQPWEIEQAKMYDPALTAREIAELQIKVFEKRTAGPLFIGGVFISYARADSAFVDIVYERLRKEGSPVWLDRHNLVPGPLQKQVADAIRFNDIILLVLSKESVKSLWVENELDIACRKEQKENRIAVCPIALDDTWKSRLAVDSPSRELWRTVEQKAVLDFSDPAQFDEQFAKLLRGLKVIYPGKASG